MRKEERLSPFFSGATGELGGRIKRLKEKYLQSWWEAAGTLPPFFKTYTQAEQKEIEAELSRFVDTMFNYMEQNHPAEAPRQMDYRAAISQTRMHMKRLFEFSGIEVDDSFADGIVVSTRIFLDKVKAFDPGMDPENIYQALRNIWVMNTLQVYFGLEIGCTDSMFAYSMLYPYTDNIMDDVTIALEKKLGVSRGLKHRLEGKPYSRPQGIEKQLDAMVGLVEEEFPREKFPVLYQGLLGIYNAQTRSLTQQRGDVPPHVVDIAGISFEKGGTSVLVDGFLIKGELTGKEEDTCFGLGVFLQLADDIQDIAADKKNSHMTMFSQAAGRWDLDVPANKLFNFIDMVLEPGRKDPVLKRMDDLFRKSFFLHIMEAVGKNKDLYSSRYVKEIQAHFPARFSFLRKMRRKLRKMLRKQKQGAFNLDVVSAGLMALTSRVYE